MQPGEHPHPDHPLKVLVADDNVDAAVSLATLFRHQGFGVQTAFDGQEALKLAVRFEPDIVVLDIGMPGLNGYEACREILRHPWARKTTLIALTGWPGKRTENLSLDAGFHRHFVKPLDAAFFEQVEQFHWQRVGAGTAHLSGLPPPRGRAPSRH